ncbi:MAG: DUF2442 domain-containing protein [Coriobacteriales bacterium]|jgi:hypothetical protein|nr:DUF2442 domain-containing protein [Coriobacteriales bacterium]MDR0350489.1 DUF2442 domain-containing protein [Coriobacteriales bacterium]
MYIKNDIAYAESPEELVKVVGVRPMDDYLIWLRFSNKEERVFDLKPLFEFPIFESLKDQRAFREVYLDYGVPTWLDGKIDIAPEKLYEDSVPLN